LKVENVVKEVREVNVVKEEWIGYGEWRPFPVGK
jgi:hypothetical protein